MSGASGHFQVKRRKPVAGSRPGTLVIPEGAPRPHIHYMDYTREKVRERDVTSAADLAPFCSETTVTWIDVQGFGDEALLREIAEIFKIHPLAMADAVNVPQRPKMDSFPPNTLLVAQMPRVDEEAGHSLEQVAIFLGPGYVLTFQEQHGDIFDPVRQRLRDGLGPMRSQGADYMAYALLDRIVDGYFPLLEREGDRLQDLEERILRDPTPRVLAELHGVRRRLGYLRRVVLSQRDALNAALRVEPSPFSDMVRVYMRDVYDHAVQVSDTVESCRDMAVGLMDIYLTTVSNRMNEIMKVLTIMASIFIPLTFVAGVYGMNFDNMPELHWRWGYPAVWVIMSALGLGLYFYFRRRGWLGGGGSTGDGGPSAT